MPRLNALHNSICRDCDNLDYYSDYFCTLEPRANIYRIECENFKEREACVQNNSVLCCQFWCDGNHPSAPMKPCPLVDARP